MKLTDHTTDPMTASINGQPPATIRQHLGTYKITDDESMKEFAEVMARGREVIGQIQVKDCCYIMLREIVPAKIALPSAGVPGL